MKGGVFACFLECLSDEPDSEYALVNGTIVTVHQKASGEGGPEPGHRPLARRPDDQIVTLSTPSAASCASSCCRPVHDMSAWALIEGSPSALLGDKAWTQLAQADDDRA